MPISKLKRWLAPLRRTPLHPQWLIREPLAKADLAKFHGLTLDIGCADGAAARLLPAGVQYIGLDYYETAMNWYRTRPTLFGDAMCLPLADASVDNALMLHVLEHLERPTAALREAHRALKAGGHLLVEVPFLYPLHDQPQDFHRWSEVGLVADLEQAGFRVLYQRGVGRPAETAALLSNLAIAHLLLEWLARRSLWLFFSPLLAALIPLSNLLGALLAPLYEDRCFMPHRVRVLCQKPGSVPADP